MIFFFVLPQLPWKSVVYYDLYNTFEFFSITQGTRDRLLLRNLYNAVILCSKVDLLLGWIQFPSTFGSKAKQLFGIL